jgi:WD40 repeat protein
MDHPNIARVFDAGATETGRPYFAMELVRGVPITEHCDAHGLGTVARLELFIIVCNAIQHAHLKGIIHRDIKPTNVLITFHDEAAVPKVIDFGIAKATGAGAEDGALFTDESQFVGTPAYMSPEQASANGMDVDTRSDIYSLGVLLYELLTGTTPFDSKQLRSAPHGEVQRILREVDPPKPSTRLNNLGQTSASPPATGSANRSRIRQTIRGELDWIVMRAIEKDRSRRYETAHELARDIRRYLDDEPVEACPPSASYRLRTFVRRHRTGVLTTIAFVATVAIAVGAYIHGMRGEQRNTDAALLESQHQRDEADRRRVEAQQATVRALAAEKQAKDELVRAAVTEAHGAQAGARSGRRFDSLKLLAAAAKINPSPQVRSQAIACMGVADMRIVRQWDSRDHAVAFSHSCTMYADCSAGGAAVIRRLPDNANPDGKIVLRLPGLARINPQLGGSGVRVAFSPDDQQVAVACDDAHVRVLALDGQTILDVAGGSACEFTPVGDAIAISSPTGPTAIYDLKSGNKRGEFSWPASDSLVFSPDGRRLAMWNYGGAENLAILEIATGKVMPVPQHAGVLGVAWHPSGKLLAIAADDRRIYIWNVVENDPKVLTFLGGHVAPVTAIAFTHGGDLLASASDDGTVRLWDPFINEELVRLFCSGAIGFSADDRVLTVAGPDGRHTLIEVADGLERRSLYAPSANRERVAFSRDGGLMACEGGRVLRFWNLTSSGMNETRADLRFATTIRFVAFDPDGASLIVAADGGLARVSIDERPLQNAGPGGMPVRRIQIADRVEPLLAPFSKDDADGEMSRDGLHLAFAPSGQDAIVVDLHKRARPLHLTSSDDTSFISISPDAKWVAAGTLKGAGDHRVRIWDAATGRIAASLPISVDANVAFSPDARWLVTVTSEELCFWEVGSWKPRRRLAVESSVSGHIFFSPDSKIVAVATQQMGTRLVDVATATEIATLEDERDQRPVGFSPDGGLLATKGRNTTLRLWDLRRVREELGPMGLDWDKAAFPPQPVQSRIDLTTTRPSGSPLP